MLGHPALPFAGGLHDSKDCSWRRVSDTPIENMVLRVYGHLAPGRRSGGGAAAGRACEAEGSVSARKTFARAELTQAGFDAGPQAILYHLEGRVEKLLSQALSPPAAGS